MKKTIIVLIALFVSIALALTACGKKLQLTELDLSRKEIELATIWYAGKTTELSPEKNEQLITILNSIEFEKCSPMDMRMPGSLSIIVEILYADGEVQKVTYPCFNYNGNTFISKCDHSPEFGTLIGDN